MLKCPWDHTFPGLCTALSKAGLGLVGTTLPPSTKTLIKPFHLFLFPIVQTLIVLPAISVVNILFYHWYFNSMEKLNFLKIYFIILSIEPNVICSLNVYLCCDINIVKQFIRKLYTECVYWLFRDPYLNSVLPYQFQKPEILCTENVVNGWSFFMTLPYVPWGLKLILEWCG